MSRKKIGILHLDLGLGGAERLIVDTAVAYQNAGHEVQVFTTHCSPSHSFRETQDGTLKVKIHGDWLPRHVLGMGTVLCAYLRMLWLTWAVLLVHHRRERFDLFLMDGVSFSLPLLRWWSGKRTLFYCHFPDSLLCVDRRSWLKRLYRAPFDWLEELTTGAADLVLVNSEFTKRTFADTFQKLHRRGLRPAVLYPPLNLHKFDQEALRCAPTADSQLAAMGVSRPFFLSLNRYERKKGIALMLQAASQLQPQTFDLVVAGGYDPRVRENLEHHQELAAEAQRLGLQVTFLFSISDEQKTVLLRSPLCMAVVYTPSNEHFGIVPIEAMYCQKPVIACASGGPLESVQHQHTGFLCEPNPAAFAQAMRTILQDFPQSTQQYGQQGRAWVAQKFSIQQFTQQLNYLTFPQ